VLWRSDGRQRSLTFENLPSAERFKTLLEDHGPDEALRVIELDEIGRHVPTVTEWLNTHIDTLTGVQPATLARYRTYVRRDIDPVFGSMPVSAVTETTVARWIRRSPTSTDSCLVRSRQPCGPASRRTKIRSGSTWPLISFVRLRRPPSSPSTRKATRPASLVRPCALAAAPSAS